MMWFCRKAFRTVRCNIICFLVIAVVAGSATFVFHLFGVPQQSNLGVSINSASNSTNVKNALILSWTPFFGVLLDDKYLNGCPELRQNCSITTDRNLYRHADAIVFHPRDMNWNSLPPSRTVSQRYVFLMHESPPHTCLDMDKKRNFFNWSMTYRMDSDVPFPYTYVAHLPSAHQPLDTAAILNKTLSKASIVWLASNCVTHSKRELYVEALQKFIAVDVFGACGPFKCPKSRDSIGQHKRSECEQMIETKYKFYIAFENSICTDYVTEKYFARRDYNSIPIVLSRRVAEPLFPPKSFIAVDDFPEGPRQLADYLKYLDQNDTAYLDYFQWRAIGYGSVARHPKSGLRFGFCGLCERLRQPVLKSEIKSYDSADNWWGEKASCDADLVPRLISKELGADPSLAKKLHSWTTRYICGF